MPIINNIDADYLSYWDRQPLILDEIINNFDDTKELLSLEIVDGDDPK